ncbi:MAG TPA: SMC-Scp complex subunit ScpB [Candidatus Tetragenococcus pullicola]|nr:SMC-Scp complex subunit ScpB [Candidatus Tetragenococcus pullicola]
MTKFSELEALLFIVGDEGIHVEVLTSLLNLQYSQTQSLIEELKKKYAENDDSALNILEVGDQIILTTKKELVPVIKKYAQSPTANRLSQAGLETLSIIAYKQPITRAEIDTVRGVKSQGAVQTLVARHLIEEKGRVDGPGRAILYGTSTYFMDYFGLKDMKELPDIQTMEEDLLEEGAVDLFFDRYESKEEDE